MDNIIQLIVFLFIIYSIFAPLFDKKRQQKNKKQIPKDYGGDGRSTRTSPKPTTQDILEDFLGFKIPKTGDEYESYSSKTESDYKDIKTVNYDTEVKIDYRNLETESKLPDIDYDKIPTYEKQSLNKISDNIDIEKTETGKDFRLAAIKNKLNKPDNLREIFLFSEIVNKPKALRR